MADLGFLPAVKRLLDRTPKVGQRLLFSATLDNGVDVLVKRYLDRPTTHSVDPAVAPVSTMTHHVFAVAAADKSAVVHELAAGAERSLLFMRTKHTAKKLAKQLTAPASRPSSCTATSARAPRAQPVGVPLRRQPGAGGHRHRRPRHPRRRRRARRARRPADRAQGLPAPLRAHRPRRRRRRRRHPRHARPVGRGPHARAPGRHPARTVSVRPGSPEITEITAPRRRTSSRPRRPSPCSAG
jgi:hypothetical protein